jgi:hypothetical protein
LALTTATLSNLINNSAAVMLLFARKNQSLRRSPNSNRPLLGDIKKESLSAASTLLGELLEVFVRRV